ncbi:hypothetical protein [Streptomyces sp. LUP47B]|uniref:hypothetical protein n=1 Tax=Streptomyces sp. LUP47B TaxID=1890286 RepID=UPI000851ABAA|nr:hypothetical protein [Streptomyces sp. LUP47B]
MSPATSDKNPCAPYVADLKAQNAADTGSTSPAVPVALAAGLATAVATTTVFALRRRRTHTATR